MRSSDWRSDVCSSDLLIGGDVGERKVRQLEEPGHEDALHVDMSVRELAVGVVGERTTRGGGRAARALDRAGDGPAAAAVDDVEGAHGEHAREVGVGDVELARGRSEERRVGKEWVSTGRSRGVPYP